MAINSQMFMIANYLDIISAGLSALFNSILIFLILTRSPIQFGTYKYLMIFISIFEVVMATMEAILIPIHYSHGSAVAVMVNITHTPFSKFTVQLLLLFTLGLFGASLAIFAVHFIYRYLAVSGSSLIKSFDSWKLFLWFLLPFSSGIAWPITAHFLCSPSQEAHEYLRAGIMRDFGEDVENFDYRLFWLYRRLDNGEIEYMTESLVAIAIASFTVGLSLIIILLFGFKCYYHISSLMKKSTCTSYQFRVLQQQLFYALVVQTLIPLLLVHIPTAVMFLFAFLEIDIGHYVAVVSMLIALYSVMDPLPNFVIIKPYREAIFDYIRCRRPEDLSPSLQTLSRDKTTPKL